MSTEHCLCCGREVPEGRQVCVTCEHYLSHRDDIVDTISEVKDSIMGIPVQTVIEILTLYKMGIQCPSDDYRKGFEDGYKKSAEDQKEAISKCLKEMNIPLT